MPRIRRDVSSIQLKILCDTLVGFGTEAKTEIMLQGCPFVQNIEGDLAHKRVTFFYLDEGGSCEHLSIRSPVGCLDSLVESKKSIIPPTRRNRNGAYISSYRKETANIFATYRDYG